MLLIRWCIIVMKVTISKERHSRDGICQDGNASTVSCSKREGILRSLNCCWRRSSRTTPHCHLKHRQEVKIRRRLRAWLATITNMFLFSLNFCCKTQIKHIIDNVSVIACPWDDLMYWLPKEYQEEVKPGRWLRALFDILQNLIVWHFEMCFDVPFSVKGDLTCLFDNSQPTVSLYDDNQLAACTMQGPQ